MAYTQAKLREVKAAAAIAGPCVVEEIQACNNWKAPTYFSCTSGVLLWGQLPTVMQGHLEKEFDTPLGPYETIKPGVNNCNTILMSRFRYRAPARQGLWKVEAVFTGKPDRPVGYVCHHIDVNGPDLLRRAAVIGGGGFSGVSLQNDHADRDIVYVNRYDWSRVGCPNAGYELMKKLLKPEKKLKEKMTPANSKPLKIGDTVELKILGPAEAEGGIVGDIVRSLGFMDDEGKNGLDADEDEYYSSGYEGSEEHEEEETEDEYDDDDDDDETEDEYEDDDDDDDDEETEEEDDGEDSEFYGSSDEEMPYWMSKKGKAEEAKIEYEHGLLTNRLMLVDEEGFPQLVQSLREGLKLDSKNYLFRDNKKGYWFPATATELSRDPSAISDAFGVNLGVCEKDNELGWLAFQEGKLIGFVYDGAYCDLRGTSFQCGDTEVEVPRPSESDSESEFEDVFIEPIESEEQTSPRPPGGSSTKVGPYCRSLVGSMTVCYNCGDGGRITRYSGCHDQIVRDSPNLQKRKYGGFQIGQSEVRHCDHCRRDGHTRDRCFILHSELKVVWNCDHCHKDGHTRDRCFALYPELKAQMRRRQKIGKMPMMTEISPAFDFTDDYYMGDFSDDECFW